VNKQPKVLFCSANPDQTTRIRVDKEYREVDHTRLISKRGFRLLSTWATTAQDLLRVVLTEEPEIVHFSGHGTRKGIILESEIGDPVVISDDGLSSLFELFADKVECVILNSCYSETQAKSINRFVPFVIGMHSSVLDLVAIKFSCGFYAALGAGKNVPLAYKTGVASIKLEELSGAENPVLLVNNEILFERKQALVIPRALSSQEQLVKHEGLGTDKSMVIVDIDDFTNINWKFGERVGDEIKNCIKEIISEYCGKMTTSVIHGWITACSDEYYILFNGSIKQGQMVAKQIIKRISNFEWRRLSPGLFLTVSCGVTDYRVGELAESILIRSLIGVKEAKMRGKNLACVGPRFLPENTRFFKLDEIREFISESHSWETVATRLTYGNKKANFDSDVEIDLVRCIDNVSFFLYGKPVLIKPRRKYAPG
jgi:GGDEF domain-containing protein